VPAWCAGLYEAFWRLSHGRRVESLPIAQRSDGVIVTKQLCRALVFGEIARYASCFGFDGDFFETFLVLTQAMDDEFLAVRAESMTS
jgi:hypothetical protein